MTTCVVKYGGSVLDDSSFLLEDIAFFARSGVRVAVVHGGGPEISGWLTRLGHSSDFVDGQRVTDDVTLDVAEMVLCGRVGKRIVRSLGRLGVPAVGVSGQDAGLVRATRHKNRALGRVGRVDGVDPGLIHCLWDSGMVPVVSPLAADSAGEVLNVNADAVAGAIAGALRADVFLLATDVPGVKESPESLYAIPNLTLQSARELIDRGAAVGGMIPKIEAALEAVAGGARDAYIVDGSAAGVLEAALRRERIGTRIGADRTGE